MQNPGGRCDCVVSFIAGAPVAEVREHALELYGNATVAASRGAEGSTKITEITARGASEWAYRPGWVGQWRERHVSR